MNKFPPVIEYYVHDKLLARVTASFTMTVGNCISIRKVTYRVTAVSYALDYADEYDREQLRCNVDLTEVKP